jgi:preprotein translocase subunit SecE
MARQTRQQRRDRRAQAAPGAGRRPPPRPPVADDSAGAGGDGGRGRREPQRRPAEQTRGFGPFRFIRESWGELRKVEWPGQQQLIQGTTVVLIACAIVGVYLYANDVVWKHVVQNFLIK